MLVMHNLKTNTIGVRVGFFLMVCLTVFIANWNALIHPLSEFGDYAANSLLMQDAKQLHLSVGHYSRFGFNHPGPALLYVLGFGELIFHDLLHWVTLPVVGQMIALCLFHSAWIAALLVLLNRWQNSWFMTVYMAGLFLVLSALCQPGFFSDLWFPYIYYLPFAVCLLALSRLVAGHLDSVLSLAFSTGFLLNGHIAFFPILTIILGMVVLHHVFRDHQLKLNRFVIRKSLLFVGIQLVFLSPLLMETIRHYPEPLASYAGYHGVPTHNFKLIFKFVAGYWGGWEYCALGLIGMGLVSLRRLASQQQATITQPLMIVLSITSIAVFVYATFGVDSFAYTYLAYFYQTVPCFMGMLLGMQLLDRGIPNQLVRNRVAMSGGLLCIGLALILILQSKPNARPPEQPQQVVSLYNTLAAQQIPGQRMVLELEDKQDTYADLSGDLLALLLYAKRQHQDVFCIHKHWNLMFTKALRCRPIEVLNAQKRYTVHWTQPAVHLSKTIPLCGLNMTFAPYTPTDIVDKGMVMQASRPRLLGKVLGGGWSVSSEDFLWSEETIATLSLWVGRGFQGEMTVDIGAFLTAKYPTQQVSIYVDKRKLSQQHFALQHNRRRVTLAIDAPQTEVIDVTFIVKHPVSPSKAHVGADNRSLGIALYGVGVNKHEPVSKL